MDNKKQQTKKCKVNGVVCGGRAMCGAIGIGKNSGICTSKGDCKYQEVVKK